MHFVKGLEHQEFKLLLYDWNNKFILKCEYGPFEQVYKFSQLDFISQEDFEQAVLKEEFIDVLRAAFQSMEKGLKIAYE